VELRLDHRSHVVAAVVALFAAVALLVPAGAGAQVSAAAAELQPIEQATAELGQAKRSASSTVARLGRRSRGLLADCASRGPGWKRIRAVEHAPQRGLYIASARRLLSDMRLLLDQQQARVVAYESAFERFVARIQAAPVSSPLLRAAVAAQARRLAAYEDIRRIEVDCKVFNRVAKLAREFPTRTAAQIVRADYRAAPRARKIERHVSNQLRAIDRRHGISWHDVVTLEKAAELMVQLGGNAGYATAFQYALSLR
jgi:hypothetical protein